MRVRKRSVKGRTSAMVIIVIAVGDKVVWVGKMYLILHRTFLTTEACL